MAEARAIGRLALAIAMAAFGCAGVPLPRAASGSNAPPTPADATSTAEFRLTMFDVGTGLAVLVQGEDFALLYDAGSNDDRASGADSRALAYLASTLGPSGGDACGAAPAESARLPIDHVLLSHPHRDHLSMLPDVLACYAVAHLWEPGQASDTRAYASFRDAAAASGATLHRAGGAEPGSGVVRFGEGTSQNLGRDARFVVLSVQEGARDPNDASIVLSLELGGVRVLLMGDATGGGRAAPASAPSPKSVEAALLARHRQDLRADVLVVGHHGSSTSSRAAFLDAVAPRYALVSSGPMPYGRVTVPDPEVIATLRVRGAQVLRTDEEDARCRTAGEKIGPDADDAPGGCSAWTIRIGPAGAIVAERGPVTDHR